MTRIDQPTADALDALVATGVVGNRSQAARLGLDRLLEDHRRRQIGQQIVAGYEQRPQSLGEIGWSDAATAAMIDAEPW